MLDYIKNELKKFNIELCSSISLGECELTRPYLLKNNGLDPTCGTAIIFAVPYLTETSAGERNISSYAVSRDYHIFFKSLFDTLIPKLKEKYPSHRFVGFTDHSPINEIDAAVRSGLGVKGMNHLLITPKHSSYIFIGEIITDAIFPYHAGEPSFCIKCGKCISACPCSANISLCLSSLTQKKGELCEEERIKIKESGCAWGCDICQQVCPYTVAAVKAQTIYTKIDFFNESLTPYLSSRDIEEMSEEEFKLRAYSWRGKGTIVRNLKILEEGQN